MKIAKIEEVIKSICKDSRIRTLLLNVMEYERGVITQTSPHFKDELDYLVEEVAKK